MSAGFLRVMAAVLTISGVGVLQAELAPTMARWTPMLGQWEIHATWSFGTTLDARAEYREGVAGQFVHARTWVSDDGGPTYLRYETTIGPGAEPGVYDLHAFAYDGRAEVRAWRVEARGESEVFTTSWTMANGAHVREEMQLVDDRTLSWQVWTRGDETGAWTRIMDGAWKKLGDREDEMVTLPVDSSTFVASGADVRRFAVSREIGAPVSEVYAAWTNGPAFRAAFAPGLDTLRADIDLAIGGRYEWLFDGVTGSNGCQVHSYVPDRMVSFTWNAPPSQSTRGKHTWVVVEFEEGDTARTTHVRLTHLGFGEGEEWDQTLAYFEKAWAFVLDTFHTNLSESEQATTEKTAAPE